MVYPDLYVFPKDHPPTPYGSPVSIGVGAKGFLPSGFRLCAVGWLEKPDFPTGMVPDECIGALANAHKTAILRDGTRGMHDCTLCEQRFKYAREPTDVEWQGEVINLKGYGHYLIQLHDTVYMAPELILHYIRRHHYCPPQEFIQATIHGRFLVGGDLDVRLDGEPGAET